jgi:hypothetical protein
MFGCAYRSRLGNHLLFLCVPQGQMSHRAVENSQASGAVVGGARLCHRWTDEGVRPHTSCARRLHDLEREAGAQLEFAAWGHGHGDGAELGRVHKAVGRAQVDHV